MLLQESSHMSTESECGPKLQDKLLHKEKGHGPSLYSLFMDSYHEHKKKRDRRRIVVLIDDADVARTALAWAMVNVVCNGDIITLLHVHPSSSSSSAQRSWIAISLSMFSICAASSQQSQVTGSKVRKGGTRLLRLKGFELALSLKDLCEVNKGANVEILVVEGERGPTVVSLAKKLGASALILGQRKRCLLGRVLHKENVSEYCIKNSNCLVLAVEHKPTKTEINGYRKTVSMVRVVRYV